MAERRMFAKSIVFSDAFLDMASSTRMLYFYLSMSADDEGVVNSPKSIMRQCGASNDDMNVLIMKKFILPVDDKGIYVIKHWFIHNYIQADRFKQSKYHKDIENLELDENKAYKCIQNGYSLDTQVRDRVRDRDRERNNIKHRYGKYDNVMLTDKELETLKNEFEDWQERIERVSEYCASKGKAYKNYLATIRNWARKEQPKKQDDLPVYDASHNIDVDLERLKDIRGETL